MSQNESGSIDEQGAPDEQSDDGLDRHFAICREVDRQLEQFTTEDLEALLASSSRDRGADDPTIEATHSEATGLDPNARVEGDVMSRYEILSEVGRGAMGIVYSARHRMLDARVALKVLKRGSKERFLREARLLAKIRSPHVVAVHDYDILSDGRPMIAMEWIEGGSLQDQIRRRAGPLAENRTVKWMSEVCLGMSAAAEEGVIHRDLKPGNILIDSRGSAKVADFGLARGPGPLQSLSTSADFLGTPFYVSPEQAEDPRRVDVRSDIYSFGATFYHALTGRVPFEGSTFFGVLFKHKTEPLRSPRTLNPRLSHRISDVLERCLAKSPSDRFHSFRDVFRRLDLESTPAWDSLDDGAVEEQMDRFRERREAYLRRPSTLEDGDIYEFSSGRRLCILRGNIVGQDVDAVVSSDDEHLSMGGGVSRALALAAGDRMIEEARKYVPVLPGRAVVTTGGNLPARFVFHGITLQLDVKSSPALRRVRQRGQAKGNAENLSLSLGSPSRDLILEIMASCFYHADTLQLRSMAFPLLATGAGGFSRSVCLDTMFRFLARTLAHGLTSVTEARIVLWDGPQNILRREES